MDYIIKVEKNRLMAKGLIAYIRGDNEKFK